MWHFQTLSIGRFPACRSEQIGGGGNNTGGGSDPPPKDGSIARPPSWVWPQVLERLENGCDVHVRDHKVHAFHPRRSGDSDNLRCAPACMVWVTINPRHVPGPTAHRLRLKKPAVLSVGRPVAATTLDHRHFEELPPPQSLSFETPIPTTPPPTIVPANHTFQHHHLQHHHLHNVVPQAESPQQPHPGTAGVRLFHSHKRERPLSPRQRSLLSTPHFYQREGWASFGRSSH